VAPAASAQTGASRELTPLSGMAALLLEHTQQARRAIVAGDGETARNRVDQALSQASEIQARASSPVKPLLVPIAAEVERTSHTGPLKRKGWGFDKQTSVHVTEDVQRVSLNVTLAADKLRAAKRLLDQDDLASADSELAAVETAVVTQSVTQDVPLAKARENLILARARLLKGKPRNAVTPLKEAAKALRQQELREPDQRLPDITALRREVEALSGSIRNKPPDALDKLNLWIEMIDQWPASR